MKVHELKTWPPLFRLVADGSKRWELRRNDRNYEAGDLLWLREWRRVEDDSSEDEYTGEATIVQVVRVYGDFDVPEGLPSGFVLMDIRRVNVVPY